MFVQVTNILKFGECGVTYLGSIVHLIILKESVITVW